MSAPVLGIDIDGVLADTDAGWATYFSRKACGGNHPSTPSRLYWNNWKDLCTTCFQKVLHTPECITSLPQILNAERAMNELSRTFRLIAVTSRNPSDALPTQEWMVWHELFPHFETVIHFDDKRSVLEHYGAVAHVDDAPDKIESLHGSTVTPVIFDQPYNRNMAGLRIHKWTSESILTIRMIQSLL